MESDRSSNLNCGEEDIYFREGIELKLSNSVLL